MFTKKYLLEINYKSGTRKRFWVKNFTVRNGLESVEWTSIGDHKPVTMNIDEVESIWQVRISRF